MAVFHRLNKAPRRTTRRHIPVLRLVCVRCKAMGLPKNTGQGQDSLSVVLYPERSCRISTIKLWFFLPCRAVRRRRRLFLALRCLLAGARICQKTDKPTTSPRAPPLTLAMPFRLHLINRSVVATRIHVCRRSSQWMRQIFIWWFCSNAQLIMCRESHDAGLVCDPAAPDSGIHRTLGRNVCAWVCLSPHRSFYVRSIKYCLLFSPRLIDSHKRVW